MTTPKSNVIRLPNAPSLTWDDCRMLVESVTDYAIFMLDTVGRVVTWNGGAEKIKGYKASEILGEHFSRFYTPEDIAAGKPDRELEIASRNGRVEEEGWRVRKDGSRLWASVVLTALRDDNGKLRGFGKVMRDLTAKRMAEEELTRSKQRFHQLVDAVIDYAIFVLDPRGNVSTWNAGARRLKGYTAEEIIGKHFSIFYTQEDQAARKPEAILEVVRREGRYEDEGWRVRKDGTQFWANVVITALRDDYGTLLGFAKVTRDFTDRRRIEAVERRVLKEQTAREVAETAEHRLRENENRYRALNERLEIVLEGVGDGITVQDRSGRLVFANSAAARICGFASVEELIHAPTAQILERFEILDEQDKPFDPEKFPGRRVLAGERASSATLHVRERRSGRDWWSLVRASAVLGVDGEPDLAINIWHDVSAEHDHERQTRYLDEATAALGASLDYDEMLSTLARVFVPGLADWCSIFVLEGHELRNVAVAHVDPAKLAKAKEYQKSFPPDPTRERGVWNVIRTGESEVYNEVTDDLLVASARDSTQLEILRNVCMKAVLLAPIRVRGEVLGVMSLVCAESDRGYDEGDVALAEELGRRAGVALENSRLYRAAQESAKAAEEASRAKDEFLATVSHELRTPLSAILGWSTLLKDRVTDPVVMKPIEVIHRNAQRQVRIIDDILDVSRVITGKLRLDAKPTDFVSIAREALEVVRPSAFAKHIDVEFCPLGDLCVVGDPERLQQVVWNLLSNAVKFTEPGGKIRVSLSQEGSNVVLAVSDSGRGIAPEFLPFVFQRFKQADSSVTRRVGGLGLGLALVRHIIELHGGHVAATSDGIGRGSTFAVTLPIRAVLPKPTPSQPPPASAPQAPIPIVLRGVYVLVVDDEPDARDLIAAVLMEAGATVETARSAAEGLDAFRRFQPNVLVSDIGMPDEDGFSFMRRVRALPDAEGGRVPSLALTAFAHEEHRAKAIEAGYTAHIGKPVNPDALTIAVANLLAVAPRS